MEFSLKEVRKAQIDLLHKKLKEEYSISGEYIYVDCQKKIFSEMTVYDKGKNFYFNRAEEKNEWIARYIQKRFILDGFEVEFKVTKDEFVVLVRWSD